MSRRFAVQDTTYFCVLDFEGTCWRDVRSPQQEIIEFPSVLMRMDWNTQFIEPIGEFHQYVKPVLHPELSEFCTELTGITQEQVDVALTLPEVLQAHEEWLVSCFETHPEDDPKSLIFVTCGNWDLKTMLPLEYSNKSDVLPSLNASFYHHFLNIKFVFEACLPGKSAKGMTQMLAQLHLPLLGRHHSGIDDTRNIASILRELLQTRHILTPAIVTRQAQEFKVQRHSSHSHRKK